MDDTDPTCNYAFQTLVTLKSQPQKTVLVCGLIARTHKGVNDP